MTDLGLQGANAEFELIKFTGPDDPRIAELSAGMAHGLPNTDEHWVVKDKPGSPKGGIASSQAFGGGNGGEYRKSFHGTATFGIIVLTVSRGLISSAPPHTRRVPCSTSYP